LAELEDEKYLDKNQESASMIVQVNANEEIMQRLMTKKSKIQMYQQTLDMGVVTPFVNVEEAYEKHRYRRMMWLAIKEWSSMVSRWEVLKFDDIVQKQKPTKMDEQAKNTDMKQIPAKADESINIDTKPI
jgi:hypothetical protein